MWLAASIQLPVGKYQLVFDGTIGYSFTSDIAIDDISVRPGICRPEGKICHMKKLNLMQNIKYTQI